MAPELAIVYVCSLFMIGRNAVSLIMQIRSLFLEEKKKELAENKLGYFVFTGLVLTAVLGIICGIGLLFENQIFPFYLFFIVSGMMIYSYLTYAGNNFDEKKWIMFAVCILVIIFTAILAAVLAYYMVTLGFD
ncbi:MAG: hypothetical protein FK733_19495 [Asgard group archaeon]|nr:hypothetical protein [Asgard group archaeon]